MTAAPIEPVRLHNHERLRAMREEAGKTREQVCADLGLSYPWLAALELGTTSRVPSIRLLTTLANYYGHPPAELLPGEPT